MSVEIIDGGDLEAEKVAAKAMVDKGFCGIVITVQSIVPGTDFQNPDVNNNGKLGLSIKTEALSWGDIPGPALVSVLQNIIEEMAEIGIEPSIATKIGAG